MKASVNIFIVFSVWLSQLSLNQLSSSPSLLSPTEAQGNRAKEVWPRRLTRKEHFPSLLSHFFTRMNIFRIHQLFILTISLSFTVHCICLPKPGANPQTWGKKQPKILQTFLFSCFTFEAESGQVFPSRYRSHASIVRFHLVKFSLSYCELKHLLQSNYCRDLEQHSLGNSKKCGPQHWHKHLSMLEEASLPLNRADAS